MREHAPVWALHPDGETLWREGRLLQRDARAGRCHCLIGSSATGALSEEVAVADACVYEREPLDAAVDDLAELATDNDATAVKLLRARFESAREKRIYTACGALLLAVNPWEELDPASLVRGRAADADAAASAAAWCQAGSAGPHVWSLAASAVEALVERGGTRPQSICACGVAGSGKSVACERVLAYFAGALRWDARAGAACLGPAQDVLESFGCARTLRNPRSSRFGRLVEMQLHVGDGQPQVLGARIDTFMLERARVHQAPEGEDNFRVFGQLRAAPHGPFGRLLAGPPNNGDGPQQAHQEFEALTAALDRLGISADRQLSIFRVVAGVQLLSDMRFVLHRDGSQRADGGRAGVLDFDASLAADALCCPPQALHSLLGRRRLGSADSVALNFAPGQARKIRDGLAKSLYSRLFSWLCQHINNQMEHRGGLDDSNSMVGIINVVDLPGLEAGTGTCSFDQMFLNFADERMHQAFLHFAMGAQQAEFSKEGLLGRDLPSVDLPKVDNAPIIKEMETVFGLLEDQHRRGKHGSDTHFLQSIHHHVKQARKGVAGQHSKRLPQHANVLTVSKQLKELAHFQVRHYWGECVTYDAKGFIKQNEDSSHMDVVELALADCCRDAFISELLADGRPTNAQQRHGTSVLDARHRPQWSCRSSHQSASEASFRFHSSDASHPRAKSLTFSAGGVDLEVTPRQTLVSAHMGCMNALFDLLDSCEMHFVRCLLPNELQDPKHFSERCVYSQLQTQGVLEAVRASRRDFPHRLAHRNILTRYWLCAHDDLLTGSVREVSTKRVWEAVGQSQQRQKGAVCALLLACPALDEQSYAVGRRNTYLQHETMLVLQSSRDRMLPTMYLRAQTAARGFLARLRCRNIRLAARKLAAAKQLQRWWRAKNEWRSRLRMLQTVKRARREERLKKKRLEELEAVQAEQERAARREQQLQEEKVAREAAVQAAKEAAKQERKMRRRQNALAQQATARHTGSEFPRVDAWIRSEQHDAGADGLAEHRRSSLGHPPAEVMMAFYKKHAPSLARSERVLRVVMSYRRRCMRQHPRWDTAQCDAVMYDEVASRHGIDPRAFWLTVTGATTAAPEGPADGSATTEPVLPGSPATPPRTGSTHESTAQTQSPSTPRIDAMLAEFETSKSTDTSDGSSEWEPPPIFSAETNKQAATGMALQKPTARSSPTWDRVAEAGTSKKRAAKAKGVRTKVKAASTANGRKAESPSAASLDSLYLSWQQQQQQQQQQRAQAGRRSAPPSASNGAAWDACSQ